jgi:hypothetical protein
MQTIASSRALSSVHFVHTTSLPPSNLFVLSNLSVTISPLLSLIDRSISFYYGKARTILIDVRAESNLKEGELCPKARKRKL